MELDNIDRQRSMKTTYKNPWHKNEFGTTTTEMFVSDSTPHEYKGHLIYERREFGYPIFDVVKDGVCVTQLAGLNGAKAKIDRLLDPNKMLTFFSDSDTVLKIN